MDLVDLGSPPPSTPHTPASTIPGTPASMASPALSAPRTMSPLSVRSAPVRGSYLSAPMEQSRSFPAYPDITRGPSKAIAIVSPTQPQFEQQVKPEPDDTDGTAKPSEDKPLRERRGKAEILSLYSVPPTFIIPPLEPCMVPLPLTPLSADGFTSPSPFTQGTETVPRERFVTDPWDFSGLSAEIQALNETQARPDAALTQQTLFASLTTPADYAYEVQPLIDTPASDERHLRHPHQEIFDELQELKQLHEEMRGAQARYQAGREEAEERVRQALFRDECRLRMTGLPSSSEISDASIQLQATIFSLRSDQQRLLLTSQEHKDSLDQAHRDLVSKEEELSDAYKRIVKAEGESEALRAKIMELIDKENRRERKYLKLKGMLQMVSEQPRLMKQVKADVQDPALVAVLLDGHARMFPPELLEKGEEGGQRLALQLLDAVQQAVECHLPEQDIQFIVVQAFLDAPRISKQLKLVGAVRDFAAFRSFCDGFNSVSDLISVVDADGPEASANKMREHIKMYFANPCCKMILVGANSGEEYVDLLTALGKKQTGHPSPFYAIRAAKEIDNDPFVSLGKDKLVMVDGMFGMSSSAWRGKLQDAKATTTMTVSEVSGLMSRPPTRPPTTISPSASSVATIRRSPQPSEYTLHRQSSTLLKVGQAPWSRPEIPSTLTPSFTSAAQGPRSEFMSVVDRTYQLSPTTTPKASMASQVGQSPPHSPTPQMNRRPKEHRIVIPLRPGEEVSIGGSPPESDEDDPSVPLPHSAVKHVQRPTVIEGPGAAPSLPLGFKIRGASVSGATPVVPAPTATSTATVSESRFSDRDSDIYSTAAWKAAPWARKAPVSAKARVAQALGPVSSISGANTTPLGSRGQPAADERMLGFQGLGKAGHVARRKTAEYKYLSSLQPRPCHQHYLEGHCPTYPCPFGHNHPLTLDQWNMLRLLAKEMNCYKVKNGKCDKKEQECIYSHRCPNGPQCDFGDKCWFEGFPDAHRRR